MARGIQNDYYEAAVNTNHPDYRDSPVLTVENTNYYTHAFRDSSWIELHPDIQEKSHNNGWKFRVSVDANDIGAGGFSENLAKSWEIVVKRITDSGLPVAAKTANPKTARDFSDPDNHQAGKMITIYALDGVEPAKMQTLMQQIQRDLQQAEIKPGLKTQTDRNILGSEYLSYRNDKVDGGYNTAENVLFMDEDRRYNPSGGTDPYKNFEIQPSTGSFIDRLEISDRRWAHKGAWELTDPETGKQYYIKRAPQEELDLTRRLQDVKLPADSNLVLPKIPGDGEKLPSHVLDEVRAWDSGRFPRDALLLTEKHDTILGRDGSPSTSFNLGKDPSALRGVRINQQDVNLLMRDVEALNRNGLYNSDFGSNLFYSRGNDGKLRFHAIDFEPSTFDRSAGLGKYEDVDHLEKQLRHLQERGMIEENVRLNPNSDKERLAALDWQSAFTAKGEAVTRVSVANWPEEQIGFMQEALKAQGINSERHTSSTLGETVRIPNDNFVEFQRLLREQDIRTLSAGGWKSQASALEVAVGQSAPQQIARFEQAMARTGVQGERVVDANGNRSLRVSGDSNIARLEQLTTPQENIFKVSEVRPNMVQQPSHIPVQAEPGRAAQPDMPSLRPSFQEALAKGMEASKAGAGFHQTGRGVGVAMGAYGLYEQYKNSGEDLSNKQTSTLAATSMAANAGAVVADTVEIGSAARVAKNSRLVERVADVGDDLAKLGKASRALAGASKVARIAPIASIGLTVVAGTVEGTIGYKTGDGARTARAAGSTIGGVGGALAGGVVGAKGGALIGGTIGAFFGGVGAVPGAAIGGFVGGLGGAIYGGFKGAELGGKGAERLAGKALQDKFDERLQPALKGLNANKTWVAHLDRNNDHKVDVKELRRSLNGHGIKNQAGMDANHDGNISAKELSQTLNRSIAEERREIAIDRRGMDKMSGDQLRKAIHDDNILPDTVKIGGKQVDITTALKNPEYLDKVADRFEAMHVRGDHDYSKQVAMLRELQERQSGQMIPTQTGPSMMPQLGR